MAFEGPQKKRKVLISMGVLAAIVVGAGLGTMALAGYFRGQDPIYQCIDNPAEQAYQLSVRVTVLEDGFPARVPSGIGVEDGCTRPVHTLEENVIHVGYSRPHEFTLGHFLYYWIRDDLGRYDTQVYVNDSLHTEGSFLDIPLRSGDSIRIEFTSRN
jgi:hypothetical protein